MAYSAAQQRLAPDAAIAAAGGGTTPFEVIAAAGGGTTPFEVGFVWKVLAPQPPSW